MSTAGLCLFDASSPVIFLKCGPLRVSQGMINVGVGVSYSCTVVLCSQFCNKSMVTHTMLSCDQLVYSDSVYQVQLSLSVRLEKYATQQDNVSFRPNSKHYKQQVLHQLIVHLITKCKSQKVPIFPSSRLLSLRSADISRSYTYLIRASRCWSEQTHRRARRHARPESNITRHDSRRHCDYSHSESKPGSSVASYR
jgi:hypothetical protein